MIQTMNNVVGLESEQKIKTYHGDFMWKTQSQKSTNDLLGRILSESAQGQPEPFQLLAYLGFMV